MPTPTRYEGKRIVSDRTARRIPDVLTNIGDGSMRRVFDMGDVVVKLTTHDQWANLKEAEIWEKIRDTDLAHLFAAVLACSPKGDWLVMEKADGGDFNKHFGQYSKKAYAASDKMWMDNEQAFRDLGMNRDAHPGNFGVMADGRQVFIDYGY